MSRAAAALGRWLDLALDALVALIFGAMLLLAAGQIVLRNLFDYSLLWGDGLVRLLVLWLAMAGAMAASRADKHIRIAVLDRLLPDPVMRWVQPLLDAFTAGICGLLAWHAGRMVVDAWRYEDVLIGFLPAWIGQLIMPLGFAVIALRYAVATGLGLVRPRERAGP